MEEKKVINKREIFQKFIIIYTSFLMISSLSNLSATHPNWQNRKVKKGKLFRKKINSITNLKNYIEK